MNKNRIAVPLILATLIISMLQTASLAAGMKYKTSGTYVDGAGGQHAWTINEAHTLIWESAPYIPVGGVFTSRYLSSAPTDENFQSDIKALEAVKAKGITDIILRAAVPITSVDPEALQKMVNHLDTNGFTYGIAMEDGPKDPLKGYLISPNRYRLEGPSDQATITCDWPDVDSAMFVVINKADNTIAANGGAVLKDGKVTINLGEPLGSGHILIVYPHKVYKGIAEGGMGDIWSGFSEYRDRVLGFFKKVKLGPGMRFFLEPFTSKMDFTDEMMGLVPDSTGFRLGLEAYLTKKHGHEGSVNAKWGLNENLASIEIASRLMPLWYSGRGLPYAYDRASAHFYPIDPNVTQTWRDIIDFRDTSAQQYMNTMADTLRKQVANVPVIYKASKYHRIYANPFGLGGYDGLGVEAYGAGEEVVAKYGGPVYSLSEETAKTNWFIAAAAQIAPPKKAGAGYPDQNTMTASLDLLREVGVKGFFIESLQSLPDDPRGGGLSAVSDTKHLDWLADFKSKLNNDSLTSFRPTVVPYPVAPTTGAYVKRLAPNTWWLPTLKLGKSSYIGDGLAAYSLLGEDRTYMWSSIGDKTVTLKQGPTGTPSIEFPADAKLEKHKGGLFGVKLTNGPTMLRGLDFTLVFPQETADAEIARLNELIPEADKAGLSVQKAKASLDNAKMVLKNGQPLIAYGIAQKALMELLMGLGADVWMEGEQSLAQNFDLMAPIPGASNALALVLDTEENPPLAPYIASYTFDAPANSSYEVWIAGTPPAEGSTMSYTMNDVNWIPVAADGKTENYATGLAWYKIGTVNLFPGKHTLRLKADGRRSQDNRFYFAIDAVVFSPRGFKPNGVIKPF